MPFRITASKRARDQLVLIKKTTSFNDYYVHKKTAPLKSRYHLKNINLKSCKRAED